MSTANALTFALVFKMIDQLTAPMKKVNESVAGVGTAAVGASGKTGGLTTGLNNNTRAATGLGAAIGRTAQKFTQSYDAMIAKTKQLAERMKDAGDRAQLGAAATGTGVAKSLAAFKDLEAAQTNLKVAMMGKGGVVNQADYAGMSKLADQLGKDYMGSTEDFYKMFRVLQEQGIQVKDILSGTGKAVADFAAVTGEDYVNAAMKIAKFQDSFGIAAQDMTKFTNQASQAKFAFGLDTTEIFYAMPYLSGSLKQLNLQGAGASESVLRLVGMMSQAGMPATQIGTSLDQLVARMADFDNRISKNSVKMKKVREELSGTGIEFNFWDENDKFVGFEKMIGELEKMKGLTEKKRIEIGKALFGDVAGKGVAVLAEKGIAGWKEAGEVVARQASQTERLAALQDTLAFKWDSFTGTVKTFTAAIGGAINNSTGLKTLLDTFNDLFGGMTAWMKEHKTLAGIIGITLAATAALTAGVVALGGAVMVGGSILSAYGTGLSAIRLVAGPVAREIKLLVMAMRGMSTAQAQQGMFGEVIGGATAARSRIFNAVVAMKGWTAAQATAFRANFLTISGLKGMAVAFGSGLLSGIKAAIVAVRAFNLSLLANPVGLIVTGLVLGALLIIAYWKPIKAFFGGLWSGFKEGLAPLKEVFKSASAAAKPLKEMFAPVIGFIKQLLTPLGVTNKTLSTTALIGKGIGYILALAFTSPIYAITGIIKAITTVWATLRMLRAAFSLLGLVGLKMAFHALTKQFFDGGANIAKSIGSGIMSAINAPVEAIKSVVKKVRNFLPFSPAKEGALKDINRIRLVETIAESIKPAPMVQAMKGATAAAMLAATVAVTPVPGLAQPAAGQAQRPAVATLARPATAPGQGGGLNITFSPQITVQGGGDPAQISGQVGEAMRISFAEFERMMKQYERQNARKAF